MDANKREFQGSAQEPPPHSRPFDNLRVLSTVEGLALAARESSLAQRRGRRIRVHSRPFAVKKSGGRAYRCLNAGGSRYYLTRTQLPTMLPRLFAIFLLCTSGLGAAPATFRHPGVLLNRAQLDLIKHRVAQGIEPQKTAFTALLASPYADLNYTPTPAPPSNVVRTRDRIWAARTSGATSSPRGRSRSTIFITGWAANSRAWRR